MRVDDFDFTLPPALIAHHPLAERSASRLLVLEAAKPLEHAHFIDLLAYLTPNDLVVFNNTRVIPARLLGHKSTGGRVELFIERILDTHRALVHLRAGKNIPLGGRITLENATYATLLERAEGLCTIHCDMPLAELLEAVGHIPLPPYINRADTPDDRTRYQTVYAERPGAVAAPTAGLHFDQPLLERMQAKGIASAFVTLHVGAGTFQNIRVTEVAEHQMHHEWIEVPPLVVAAVAACQARGGRVVAVGTTSVRALESAAHNGSLQPFVGDTNIFIYPGYRFRVVDALITNFHLPQSSLLMLVCAFAGYPEVMAAYRAAIAAEYRFFSYGDAMLLTHNINAQGPTELCDAV